jgi:hypothetical protein
MWYGFYRYALAVWTPPPPPTWFPDGVWLP